MYERGIFRSSIPINDCETIKSQNNLLTKKKKRENYLINYKIYIKDSVNIHRLTGTV